jgi:hypothetical protein
MQNFCASAFSYIETVNPQNITANYRTKWASPIQLNQDEREVGFVEISNPTGKSQVEDATPQSNVLILQTALF